MNLYIVKNLLQMMRHIFTIEHTIGERVYSVYTFP